MAAAHLKADRRPRPAAQANPAPRGGPEHTSGRQNGGAQPARPASEPSNANHGNFQAHPNEPPNANHGNFQAHPNEPSNAMRGNPRPAHRACQRHARIRRFPSRFQQRPQLSSEFQRPTPLSCCRLSPAPGYYARRWSWGQTLPPLFWARQYWLMDYTIYALPPPPFGAIWVRVGDDALLIDQTDGDNHRGGLRGVLLTPLDLDPAARNCCALVMTFSPCTAKPLAGGDVSERLRERDSGGRHNAPYLGPSHAINGHRAVASGARS